MRHLNGCRGRVASKRLTEVLLEPIPNDATLCLENIGVGRLVRPHIAGAQDLVLGDLRDLLRRLIRGGVVLGPGVPLLFEGLLENLPLLGVHVVQVQLDAPITLCSARLGSFISRCLGHHEIGGEILSPSLTLDVDRGVIERNLHTSLKSKHRSICHGARSLIL